MSIISRIAVEEQTIQYRIPWSLWGKLAWSTLTLKPRSFASDAREAAGGLYPPLELVGQHHIPADGPMLVVCNHYSRPGFNVWWIALAISAAVAAHRSSSADIEMHWVMTAAWTFPESPWRHRYLTPLSRWVFDRIARVYGFVTMPPMPPDPAEVEERAAAILRTLRLAREAVKQGGIIGLAPEGMDTTERLGQPPTGAGSYIALLVEAGLPVLPVSVTEHSGRLRVSCGPVFVPTIPAKRQGRDEAVTAQIMDAIRQQLPGTVVKTQYKAQKSEDHVMQTAAGENTAPSRHKNSESA